MRGYVLLVGAFLFLSIGFVDAAPPLWLTPAASFTYHGYGSSNAGATTVFMRYTVQSAGAGGLAIRRESTEETSGTKLESSVLSYAQTDQAGEFWLDTAQAQTLKAGDTIIIHTNVGYIPLALQSRGPQNLGDPKNGLKHYNDILIFSMTSTGSDKTTQINYNYYFNGENGLLISYSEYMGVNLGKPEQNLASKVVVYLIKTDADFTIVSQKPPASTSAQVSPQVTPPDINGKNSSQQSSPGYCFSALTFFLAFSSALAAKVAGF